MHSRRSKRTLVSLLALLVATAGQPSAGRADIPDHLKPGQHTLEFGPSAERSMWRKTIDKEHFGPHFDTNDPNQLFVGWNGKSNNNDLFVAQTAVNFDLDKLFEAGKPTVSSAYLQLKEIEVEWLNENEEEIDVPGCILTLGFATNDWGLPPQQFMSSDFLFRDRHLTDVFIPHSTTEGEPFSIKRWRALDVTGHLRSQVAYRDDPELWFGYVLHGDEDQSVAGPGAACMSRISTMRLWVTYVVSSS